MVLVVFYCHQKAVNTDSQHGETGHVEGEDVSEAEAIAHVVIGVTEAWGEPLSHVEGNGQRGLQEVSDQETGDEYDRSVFTEGLGLDYDKYAERVEWNGGKCKEGKNCHHNPTRHLTQVHHLWGSASAVQETQNDNQDKKSLAETREQHHPHIIKVLKENRKLL